jgi:TolB-like protein/DNA-binding winged helix-turn-helix (wHTH) protein/cytochrome c-type biogenesis protein CcmH/NrfG
MSSLGADGSVQTRVSRLQFGRYILDLDRGCLFLDGSEIALRPKTFAVLRYLVEHCGRLVSKEELFEAIWPKLVVTDDALVQSIGELRHALGHDGPRLIKTIPRRGYRFESDVSAASIESPSPDPTQVPLSCDQQPANPAKVEPNTLARSTTAWPRRRWLAVIGLAGLTVAAAIGVCFETDWNPLAVLGLAEHKMAQKTDRGGAKVAIAILPLVNRSDDLPREYFVDGLTQDIINALGRFSELTVMSWNAVSVYKGRPSNPGEIARALGVHYQVEGSVIQTADRIRVNAQLVNAQGRVLWTGRFDEARADLFALQDKITTEIAGALAVRVTKIEQQRVLTKPAENLESYDYVLRARPALQRPTRANNVESRALLRRAIDLDPNSAAAYAALAEAYYVAVAMGWAESPTESLARAEEMANEALKLDDSEVSALVTLGRIHIFYHRYEQAKAELERTIATNPSDAHALAGRGNVQMWLGQTEAAIDSLERARRIDPDLNPIDRNALSLAYYLNRRYDSAIAEAEVNLRNTSEANFSRIVLAAAYAQQDRTEDAGRIAASIRRMYPTFDPQAFGSKFLKPTDLDHLREGFRKAGLLTSDGGPRPAS